MSHVWFVFCTGEQHSVTAMHTVQIRQELQLMLTNPRDAFRGQSASPNIITFHMLGIVSSCAIVILNLSFSDIRVKKCHDLEIRVRGHSRLLKVVLCDRLHMVS